MLLALSVTMAIHALSAERPAEIPADTRAQVPQVPAAIALNIFKFEIEPTRVVLGEEGKIVVTITARLPDGTVLDGAPPRVNASAGELSEPVWSAPGVWKSNYTPPDAPMPAIALLMATVDSSTTTAVGYYPLHLWGKAASKVKTEPGSAVTALIGGATFGPVKADASGVAMIPLLVPPGVSRGVARVVDEANNKTEQVIDLGVPPRSHVGLLPLDEVIAGDGSSVARIVAVATDARGAALPNATFKMKANIGELDAPSPLAPGIYAINFRPGKTKATSAEMEVYLEGAAPSSTVKAVIDLISGPPAGAEIKLSKDEITADEEDRQITATVQLVDAAGNPVPPQAARMISDHGHLFDLKKDVNGTRSFAWVVPWSRTRREATLSVELSPSRQVLAKTTIKMPPGAPAKLAFEKGGAVIADGQASVDLALRATDKWGTPLVLDGAVVEVEPDEGVIATKLDGEVLRATFTPKPVEQLRIVKVRAQFGEVSAETLVNVRPAPQLAVLVAPGLAVGTNYESLVSLGPDVSVLVRLPIVDGALHVGGSLAFMQSVVRPQTAVDQRAIPLLIEAAWRPPMSEQVDLHLGIAAGPLLAHSVRPPSDNFFEFGVAGQAVLGAAVKLGPGTLDILARLGSSNYVGAVQRGREIVGVPYGGALVTAYRFAF